MPVCQTEMTDREAMCLPSHYIDSAVIDINDEIEQVRALSVNDLVTIIDTSDSIKLRYAAGLILGLIGDPRIKVLSPEMIKISGGDFYIGIDIKEVADVVARYQDVGVEEKWILKEAPRHKVNVNTFSMAKYPVTNLEYREFLLNTQHDELPTSWSLGVFPVEKANHPVYSISLASIDKYIQWLNKKTGENYRLPTEQEWEVAASGYEQKEFPWGDFFDSSHANTVELGIYRTTPVGMFKTGASELGIQDLAGNVEEYVANDYYVYPNGLKQIDHLNESADSYRVARGGSFARFEDLARNSRRHGRFPKFEREIFAMGFRLAKSC